MSDSDIILSAFNDHRQETRADLKDLRSATAEMASAVARLTTCVARVEERHARHDEGVRRIVSQLERQDERIHALELNVSARGSAMSGGWKVITVIGGVVTTLIVIATSAGWLS